jgi:hypothetical protein
VHEESKISASGITYPADHPEGAAVSFEELDKIKVEYRKKMFERDYDFLDSMALKLRFFKKFNKLARVRLLKFAEIIEY